MSSAIADGSNSTGLGAAPHKPTARRRRRTARSDRALVALGIGRELSPHPYDLIRTGWVRSPPCSWPPGCRTP